MAQNGECQKAKLSLLDAAHHETRPEIQLQNHATTSKSSTISRNNIPETREFQTQSKPESEALFGQPNDRLSQDAMSAPVPTQGLSKWIDSITNSLRRRSADAAESPFDKGPSFMGETHSSRIRRGEGEDQKRKLEELALKSRRFSVGQDTAFGFREFPGQGSYNDGRLLLGRRLSEHFNKIPPRDNPSLQKDTRPSSPVVSAEQYTSPHSFRGRHVGNLGRRGSFLRGASPFSAGYSIRQEGTGMLPQETGGTKTGYYSKSSIRNQRSQSIPRPLTLIDDERNSPAISTKSPVPRWWDRSDHSSSPSETQNYNIGITESIRAEWQKRDRGFDMVDIDEHQIIKEKSGDGLNQDEPNGKKAEAMMDTIERENMENAIANTNYQGIVKKLEQRLAAAESNIKTLETQTTDDAITILNYITKNSEMQELLRAKEDRIKKLETKDSNVPVIGLKAKIWEMEEERKFTERKTVELETQNQSEREKAEKCQDELHKYEAAMLTLIDDLAAVRRAITENSAGIGEFQVVLRKGEYQSEEFISLRAELTHVIGLYVSRSSNLEEQSEKLVVKSREQEQTVKSLEGKLRRYAAIKRSDEVNDEDSTQKDSKMKILEEKQKSFEFLERQYKNLKAKIIKMDPKALNDELIELREKYTQLKDWHNLLGHDRDEWKTRAKLWEEDYQTATEHYELEKKELESVIHAIQAEEFYYIQEYHNHIPKNNPNWYEIKSLQKQIKSLEGEKKDLLEGKRTAEKRRDDAILEFKRLRAAVKAGETVTYHPATCGSNPRLSFLTDDPNSPKKVYRPKYESIQETEKRSTYLKGFKESQKALRKNEYAEEELVEKARKWAIEENYPLKRGDVEEIIRKRAWDRWDVDRYLESERATTKDRDIAQNIVKY